MMAVDVPWGGGSGLRSSEEKDNRFLVEHHLQGKGPCHSLSQHKNIGPALKRSNLGKEPLSQ